VIRQPAVAGSFYPAAADRLESLVADLLDAAATSAGAAAESRSVPGGTDNDRGGDAAAPAPRGLAGLLVPHAGLVYSGVVAGAAWRLLLYGGGAEAPTVVVLGTNHRAGWLDGVGVWDTGAWRMPFGDVAVDDSLADGIIGLGQPFAVDRDAHEGEHSIEVQLPFLHAVAPDARIVPLAVSIGRGRPAVEAGVRLGRLLAQCVAQGHPTVLAISTDMAHYPPAGECARITEELLEPILALDPADLDAREGRLRDGRAGLYCGMCGIDPALLGLAALRTMGVSRVTRLAAATSADAGGPPYESVGYLAVSFAV
jgi:hypothetical protein